MMVAFKKISPASTNGVIFEISIQHVNFHGEGVSFDSIADPEIQNQKSPLWIYVPKSPSRSKPLLNSSSLNQKYALSQIGK